MDIAREICTDNFYAVNSGLPRVAVTAVYKIYKKDDFSQDSVPNGRLKLRNDLSLGRLLREGRRFIQMMATLLLHGATMS